MESLDAPRRAGLARLHRVLSAAGLVRRRRRTSPRQRLGRRMERGAERMLRRRGLVTVARNYRRRSGEIDLVMLDRGTLVFVEVRYRGPGAWTTGIGSVDAGKRRRVVRTAHAYRREHPQHRLRPVRFDVVSAAKGNYRIRWDWIRDAF